ncbi:uncharacterized protein RCC_09829 [Ramularia collo-cygni]|uniref:Histone H4 n=1 Tax=Ramularia collo-cygni TaxID=112498 RepID=A0A2D3VFY0_9PEZI|nr:uncharacterized protein RCC_09829 [Ramularia collo-cygni]CZT24112.1 uncharacterized protein RCC_09829 [Ramularia collo-cygni]
MASSRRSGRNPFGAAAADTLKKSSPKNPAPAQKAATHKSKNKNLTRGNLQSTTKAELMRLLRRGGVKQTKVEVYSEIRVAIKQRLEMMVAAAGNLAIYRGGKVVTLEDVKYVLESLPKTD